MHCSYEAIPNGPMSQKLEKLLTTAAVSSKKFLLIKAYLSQIHPIHVSEAYLRNVGRVLLCTRWYLRCILFTRYYNML